MNGKHGGTNQNSRHCTENYLGLWNWYAEETYFLGFFKANELNLINNICPWRHIWEWKTAFLTIGKLVSNMKNSTLAYIHTGNSNCQAFQFSFLCNTSGGLVFCSVSWVKAAAKCQNWGFSPIQAHHGQDGILGVVAPAKYPRTCAGCFLSMLDNALQPVSIRSSLLSSSTVQTNQIRASKQRNIALLHIIVYIFKYKFWSDIPKQVECREGGAFPWPSLMICLVTPCCKTSTSVLTFGGSFSSLPSAGLAADSSTPPAPSSCPKQVQCSLELQVTSQHQSTSSEASLT